MWATHLLLAPVHIGWKTNTLPNHPRMDSPFTIKVRRTVLVAVQMVVRSSAQLVIFVADVIDLSI